LSVTEREIPDNCHAAQQPWMLTFLIDLVTMPVPLLPGLHSTYSALLLERMSSRGIAFFHTDLQQLLLLLLRLLLLLLLVPMLVSSLPGAKSA